MKNNRTISRLQRCFFVTFLFVLSIFFAVPIYAQNEQSAENSKAKLNNKIPKHLPIKVEIEDAETDDLLDTIKVKVTNTGDKPIYFLLFDFVPLDVISSDGLPYSFHFTYGRRSLYADGEMAKPEDDPLMPGESHTFAYDKSLLARWEEMREVEKHPKPKNFDLNFRKLSFGDGTGFWSKTGLPFSRAKKDQNGNKPVSMTNSLSPPLTDRRNAKYL